jgi:hypothetical protein
MELDMYDFCTPELKKQLEGPRNALKEYLDKQAEEKKTKKQKQGDKPGDSEPAAAAASSSAPAAENGSGKAAEGAGDGDVEMKDAGAPSSSSPGSYAGQATGGDWGHWAWRRVEQETQLQFCIPDFQGHTHHARAAAQSAGYLVARWACCICCCWMPTSRQLPC